MKSFSLVLAPDFASSLPKTGHTDATSLPWTKPPLDIPTLPRDQSNPSRILPRRKYLVAAMGGLNMRWLVNAGLLVLPIATTLGILFGLQKHRELNGQDPLFAPGPGDGPDNEPSNGVKNDQYCQKSYGIQVETEGQEYTCRFERSVDFPVHSISQESPEPKRMGARLNRASFASCPASISLSKIICLSY